MEPKYNARSQEQQIQAWWQQNQIYAHTKENRPLFTIDTPPPTVSGSLHIGHIFSYTQTDIIARFKRLSGFTVFYPFGFDDNGLPTERFVEKIHKVNAHTLGRAAFIQLCLQETKNIQSVFVALWQAMGLSADFSHPYSTIAPSTRALSQASFISLYKRGYIYRAYEPAPYCTTCRTSVAQAELDDAEKSSFFNTIIFKDAQGNNLLIGTTRPEFLPACVALFYHPSDTRYQYLHNQQVTVPLFNFTVPVHADTRVDPHKGTGLVMCCTFGDSTDIAWFKEFGLHHKPLLQTNGIWAEGAGILSGMTVEQSRKHIVEQLTAHQLIVEQKPIMHMVNVHERCKKEIEFISLPQWFLKLKEYKDTFTSLANQVNWYPAYMKNRYVDWVTNIKWDWCISRQRFFGIPFPVWHCTACKHILLAENNMLPVDPQEMLYPGKKCTHCGSENIAPDTDVMDTWNTSSLTPYICAQLYAQDNGTLYFEPERTTAPPFIPMSMRPQAHDIIRTWAFDTLVKSWLHHNTVAWNDIVISGHVLSGEKEKLSKSKGQKAMSPEELLKNHCADAIRYWTATSSLGTDTVFADTQLAMANRLITKLWNAFRFIKEHTQSVTSLHEKNGEILGSYNQWIMHRASTAFQQYEHAFAQYEFSQALETTNTFFWADLCDNYLELIKDQLFHPEHYLPATVESTRTTLFSVGLRILQLYAPFVPYITESIYHALYGTKLANLSIHQTQFSTFEHVVWPESVFLMEKIIELVSYVRKAKTEQQLSLKTALATLTILSDSPQLLSKLEREEPIIRGISHAHTIVYKPQTTPSSSPYVLESTDESWHLTLVIPS